MNYPNITARFLSPLRVEKVSQAHWRLLGELRYDSAVLGARIIVPIGFETDFASVPRLPVAFWLFGDEAHESAVVHDWLYTVQVFPRTIADLAFLEAMAVQPFPVPEWRRGPMYHAVDLFGEKAWNEHRHTEPEPETVVYEPLAPTEFIPLLQAP